LVCDTWSAGASPKSSPVIAQTSAKNNGVPTTVVERHDRGGDVLVRLRVLTGERGGNCRQLGARFTDRDAVGEARDQHPIANLAALIATLLRCSLTATRRDRTRVRGDGYSRTLTCTRSRGS